MAAQEYLVPIFTDIDLKSSVGDRERDRETERERQREIFLLFPAISICESCVSIKSGHLIIDFHYISVVI